MTRLEYLTSLRQRLELEVAQLELVNALRAKLGFNAPMDLPPAGLAQVCTDVGGYYGLTLSQLKARTHRFDVSHPRQHAMLECVAQLREDGRSVYSLKQIGRFLGGLDHTTVLHGARAAWDRYREGEIDLITVNPESARQRLAA